VKNLPAEDATNDLLKLIEQDLGVYMTSPV
jgi:hypothetical protein